MNDTNPGWKRQDQWYLNRHDNPSNDPDTQILTEEDYEDEDKELRQYWCALCKGRLDYIKNMDMWYCEACVSYYDTKIQDVPIKNIMDNRVKTYAELEHYHQLDDDDVFLPFVEGVNPDAVTNIPGNIQVLRDDGRIKHIRVKGLPTEALAVMNEMDNK